MQNQPTRLLVMGMPRSGTTLLANLLNSQPGFTVYSDFLASPFMNARQFGGFKKSLSDKEKMASLARMKWDLRTLHFNIDRNVESFQTIDDIYWEAIRIIGNDGDRFVGNKICMSNAVLPLVLSETDVRCIYIIRDPRDAALSWSNWNLVDALSYVHDWLDAIHLVHTIPPNPNLVIVKYEDLVLDPERAIRPIESLIGQLIETNLGELSNHAAPWIENSAFHDVTRVLDSRPVGRWRRSLEDPSVRYASWRCKKEIEMLGYAPCPSDLLTSQEIVSFYRSDLAFRAVRLGGQLKRTLTNRFIRFVSGR